MRPQTEEPSRVRGFIVHVRVSVKYNFIVVESSQRLNSMMLTVSRQMSARGETAVWISNVLKQVWSVYASNSDTVFPSSATDPLESITSVTYSPCPLCVCLSVTSAKHRAHQFNSIQFICIAHFHKLQILQKRAEPFRRATEEDPSPGWTGVIDVM